MTYRFDPKIRRLLLLSSIGFFVCAILLTIDIFYPFASPPTGIGRWAVPLVLVSCGVFGIFLFIKSPSYKPKNMAKGLGIVELSLMPFVLFALFFTFFMSPQLYAHQNMVWLFVIEVIVFVALFIFHILFLIMIFDRIKAGNDGLLPIYLRILISTILLGALMLAYIFVFIGNKVFEGYDITNQQSLLALSKVFFVFFLVYFFVFLPIFISVFLAAFVMLIAGIENRLIGVRGTFQTTAQFAKKYDLLFWVGNVVLTVMLAIALVSSIRLGGSYYSLVVLYSTLLLVRIPSFLWKQKIERGNESDYEKFKKKHRIFIYDGCVLLAFMIISLFVGEAGMAKMMDSQGAFMTYAIFVPWAIFKSVIGIRGYVIARKTGEPYLLTKAYSDLLAAIVTVTTAIFYVANHFRNGQPIDNNLDRTAAFFFLVGIFVVIIELFYSLYVSLRLIILGILGLNGKRLKFYKKHYPDDHSVENMF